ncbi:MmcQ/YjbR family DNA-binding protein [Bacillus sp. SD088]|uniref:MmcQ/YjbR family DNA-binding protein n=1 Tax=Bacillus sp. SD088 TaxID=2782012 RepID=UPI001A9570C3|nr:MmcQ/YjbR family DNA-binding protein [Bacillus sp. SD088]MBO0992966.1 MmcQ/YjbR family DNA-binding protein [Bacillus sp. SD088]
MPLSRETILDYAKRKYDTEPDYPWGKLTDYAVLRHKKNNKWYGLLMNVDRNKLSIEGEGETGILNVKCDPELASILRKENAILPAYHMNKKHWISIVLDGSVSNEEIFHLLDLSYDLTQ